jgi:hypothetical protein
MRENQPRVIQARQKDRFFLFAWNWDTWSHEHGGAVGEPNEDQQSDPRQAKRFEWL